MLLGAIADDMTGASDLAVTLKQGGMSVLQTIGIPDDPARLSGFDAVVVALKSRTVEPEVAVEQSLAAARMLLANGADQIFFKYCSTFDSTDRGNIGPVIDALLDLLGEKKTIVCPAFPATGRTVYQGHLFVGSALLSDSPMKDHPLTPMRDASLLRLLSGQSGTPVRLIAHDRVADGPDALDADFAALEGIGVVDAISDADLVTIGRAARSLKLVTGGSGLAIGLPRNFETGALGEKAVQWPRPEGPSVIVAGSCSVATRAQVADALDRGVAAFEIDPMAIAGGEIDPGKAVEFALAAPDGISLIYSSTEPARVAAAQERLGRETAGDLVEEFIATTAARLADRGVRRFIVAGGETSGAVVKALGLKYLGIGPAIGPGLVWTFSDDLGTPLAIALKSGNFGDRDFFTSAWNGL